MRRTPVVVAVTIAVLFCLTISCVNDYNPFDNYSNALMHVDTDASSFAAGDTVDIFTTETLTVFGSVRDRIDSFTIAAANNRYWSDTTIRAPIAQAPYRFLLSFRATGPQTVSITTYRSDGDGSVQVISIAAASPLSQDDIAGPLGTSYTLSTNPVGDPVYYYWSFGEYRGIQKIIKRPFADNPGEAITGVAVGARLTGYLWVTDTAGIDSSPRAAFAYEFYDSVGPEIISLTGDARLGDTIVTGEVNFHFTVTVFDASGEEIDSVEFVDGTLYPNPALSEYTAVLTGMDAYTATAPRDVTIRAWDRRGNPSERTFHIYYDARGPREQLVKLHLRVPQTPSVVTSLDSFPVLIDVENRTGGALQVRARNNGADISPERQVIDSSDVVGWTVSLNDGANTVTITAYVNGTASADTTITITRDVTAADTARPQIAGIYVNGQPLPLAQDRFYTQEDTVRVTIVAFDEGSGVAGVTVNATECSTTPGQPYQWVLDDVALQHPYNSFKISVADRAGNDTTREISVVKNSLPEMVQPQALPLALVAGVAYVETLTVRDNDNDPVTVEVRDPPQGMKTAAVSAYQWRVSFTPPDTGRMSAAIRISDGIQEATKVWSFVVVKNTASLVRFVTTSADFPRYLEAGRETLSVALEVESGFAPYRFVVRPVLSSAPIVNTTADSTLLPLVWAPQQADTGDRQFIISVIDHADISDTIKPYPTVTVVPRNADPCTLSLAADPHMNDEGVLDLSTATRPDTLRFTILDSDHPYTERFTVSVIQDNVVTEPTLSGEKSFEIVIDATTADKFRDTIVVIAADRTGSRDTIIVPVIYSIPAPEARSDVFMWNAAVESTLTLKDNAPRYVVQWRPVTKGIPVVLDTNAYLARMPTFGMVTANLNLPGQPSVHFDRARACNLVDYDQGMWPADSFTAFFVVRLDRSDADSAYTLLSSCESYGPLVALGVTGEGKAGIISGPELRRKETGSNLSINANTWYVITFRSRGIVPRTGSEFGKLTVDIWANGQAGTPVVVDSAIAGPYLIAGGSGKHDAIDGWDGDVAELIVFRRLLGDQERAGVEAYLRSRHRYIVGGPGGIVLPANQ